MEESLFYLFLCMGRIRVVSPYSFVQVETDSKLTRLSFRRNSLSFEFGRETCLTSNLKTIDVGSLEVRRVFGSRDP